MAQLFTADELAARDQALVAKCCRWVKTKTDLTGDDHLMSQNWADQLWVAMGYEGALNAFELEEKKE